uniref:Innexin n=1 Tax=Bursaphelenchus xylophilus TaxID=6326 RepID=A0A1I7RRV2_BURXY
MIEALISMARYLSAREDDDFADRMNYLYTPNMLLAFSVLISFKQFGGRPLECIFPSKFSGSLQEYAENYCWSENTYFVQPDIHVATIKESERVSPERKLSYYQWVPFFLLLQAACFRLPSFLWKCMSINSGLRIHEIVNRALDPGNMEEQTRQKNVEVLGGHISNVLKFQRHIQRRNIMIYRTFKVLNITYSACFISYMYLFTKALYVVNVVTQLYLMNRFLETDKYTWYGFEVIRDIVRGVNWQSSGFFPRVSICDFAVRSVAQIQTYSVQCVLVINIFNEKIFILLWFWYTLLTLVTIGSFVYWFLVVAFPCFGRWYVATNLELNQTEELDVKRHQKNVKKFVNEYLKQDGIFVLRMVSMHAGIIFGTELVMNLYKIFLGYQSQYKPLPKPENHYSSNLSDSLRNRKKPKDVEETGLDDLATGFIPGTPSHRSKSHSRSSSSSSDSRRSINQNI